MMSMPPLRRRLSSHSRVTLGLRFLLWAGIWLGAVAVVVMINLRDARQSLIRYGDNYLGLVNQRIVSSETILRGFAALFGSVGSSDPDKVKYYARQVIEHNPHVFALEIVQKVPREQLDAFIAQQRRAGMPHYTVKSFSYDTDRQWKPLTRKPYYYPIAFMEPLRPGSEEVLGLDMDSVPFLQKALTEALHTRTAVSSQPFRLIEGNLAYVVFAPIPRYFRQELAANRGPELVVEMVIDATQLTTPLRLPLAKGETLLVHHKDFDLSNAKGQLVRLAGPTRSELEYTLFPELVYSRALAATGEPFTLVIKRQLGWSNLSLGMLAALLLLSLISTYVLLRYLRIRQQTLQFQIENEQQLWLMANHDALTGLPNRMLLMDRMEHILSRMKRQGKHMAVMFLDLNDFKSINDTYGHDIGDHVLKIVADRLRTSLRTDDTVARLSGDEFVVLIEDVDNAVLAGELVEKLRQALQPDIHERGLQFKVHASIGLALYPEDGETPEALLREADQRMYADKQAFKQQTTSG